MSRIRSRDTAPEIALRSQLHKLGLRFRLHRADLPGSPDIVFPGRKTVVFVHGCFWHRHPRCRFAYTPKTNCAFWKAKFARNVERDKHNMRSLKGLGWRVIVVWECRLGPNTVRAARKVGEVMKAEAPNYSKRCSHDS